MNKTILLDVETETRTDTHINTCEDMKNIPVYMLYTQLHIPTAKANVTCLQAHNTVHVETKCKTCCGHIMNLKLRFNLLTLSLRTH